MDFKILYLIPIVFSLSFIGCNMQQEDTPIATPILTENTNGAASIVLPTDTTTQDDKPSTVINTSQQQHISETDYTNLMNVDITKESTPSDIGAYFSARLLEDYLVTANTLSIPTIVDGYTTTNFSAEGELKDDVYVVNITLHSTNVYSELNIAQITNDLKIQVDTIKQPVSFFVYLNEQFMDNFNNLGTN